MAVQTRLKSVRNESPKIEKYAGLTRDTLIRLYRTMYLSRKLDDREIQLKRQNKIYFQISSAGHEAVTAAMGLLLRPGADWIYPYYRDRALCLMLGVTPLDMLLQAVGAAEATLYYETHPKALAQAKKAPLGELAKHAADEIVYVSSGDGATSEGEFWE